ncbi:hypothetical protein BT96DRAFT_756272, partial [Gymnopus androsaceus JB14]
LPKNKTPFEMVHHCKPDLSHLQVWRFQAWMQVPEELCCKLGDKMIECIFVGYEENRVGWRVCNLNGKYHFSDQVVFNE